MPLKYILAISILLIYSCKENKSNADSHLFDQTRIDLKKKVKDSIRISRIRSYNKTVSKNFYHKHNPQSYKPSSTFDHVAHIRKHSRIGDFYSSSNNPKYFVEYIIKYYIDKEEHKKYITDRKLLKRLPIVNCNSNYLLINEFKIDKNTYEIELFASEFKPKHHVLKFRESDSDSKDYESIDGKFPFGGLYGPVKRSLSKINFKKNNITSSIHDNILPSINEPMFCERSMLKNGIEAYQDGKNFYIYISGGNAANTYFGKLIFNETGYVTSIFVDYVPMSMYGCFGDEFLGF